MDGAPPAAGHVIVHVPVGDRTLHAISLSPEHGARRIAFVGCGPACLDAITSALAADSRHARAQPLRTCILPAAATTTLPFASLPAADQQWIASQLLSKCTWCQRPIGPDAQPFECWYRLADDIDPRKLGWQSLTLGPRVLYGRVERDLSYEGRTGTFARLVVCSVECGDELRAEVRRLAQLSALH